MRVRVDMIVDVPDEWTMTDIEDNVSESLMVGTDVDVIEYIDIEEI